MVEHHLINPQVNGIPNAEQQARIDAGENLTRIWQGEMQQIPVNMRENPTGFADGLALGLPGVRRFRMAFNTYSFNPDGSLHPQMEAFLLRMWANGYAALWVLMDGPSQESGNSDSLIEHWPDSYSSMNGLHDWLDLMPRLATRHSEAWGKLLAWLAAHPEAQTCGFEAINEPASYGRAAARFPAEAATFVQAYVDHVEMIYHQISAAAPTADFFVGGWNYSATFDILRDTAIAGSTISALDYLRALIGSRLVWSIHLYPQWGPNARTLGSLNAWLDSRLRPILEDRMVFTEFNLQNGLANNWKLLNDDVRSTFMFARSGEWFARRGVGIGWWPVVNYAAGYMFFISAGGRLRQRQQNSYGGALGLFASGNHPDIFAPFKTQVLNDPAASVRGLTVNSVAEGSLSFISNNSDPRRTYTIPAPSGGSVIEFDITTTGSTYFRMDNENGLENPNINLWQTTVAGTFHVQVTVPHSEIYSLIGFLVSTGGVSIQVSNFRCTAVSGHSPLTIVPLDEPPTVTASDWRNGAEIADAPSFAYGFGGAGICVLSGDAQSHNFLVGGNGKNILYGGERDDQLITGLGGGVIRTGPGNNVVTVNGGSSRIYAGSGYNLISLYRGATELVLDPTGHHLIFGFSPGKGDRVSFMGAFADLVALRLVAITQSAGSNIASEVNLVISLPGGGQAIFQSGAAMADTLHRSCLDFTEGWYAPGWNEPLDYTAAQFADPIVDPSDPEIEGFRPRSRDGTLISVMDRGGTEVAISFKI